MRYCVFNTRDAWYISHSRDADSSVVNAKQWYGKKKKTKKTGRDIEKNKTYGLCGRFVRNWEFHRERRPAHKKVLLFLSFSFFFDLSLSGSLWILAAGDCEATLGPGSLSVDACAGVDVEAEDVSRRRLPKMGMPDMEPARRVVTEMRRASRWKFCDEIRLRFGSASGSGEPVRSGVPTSGAKVMPGVWAVEGVFCDAASS